MLLRYEAVRINVGRCHYVELLGTLHAAVYNSIQIGI